MVKLKILLALFLIGFIAICCKLFYLQIINANSYGNDYLTTTKIVPERGRITDRNGLPLAINETSYLVYIEPKKVTEKDTLIRKLDDILHIGEATIEARIDPNKYWVSLQTKVAKETKDQIEKLNLAGVGFQPESGRYYPEASLSAHLLGFVGKDAQGENIGYFGVEGFYDKDLAGLPGLVKSERDLAGRPIFFGTQERMEPENGRELVLTIDKSVQNIAKTKLIKGMETSQAKEGCVIIADPNNLEILALTCLPDFDPKTYYDFTDKVYKNPAISDLYEPGSTFKPLIVAAGIEEKAIQPDEVFHETGPVTIGEYSIKTWDNKYAGDIDITQILEKSSNVGMVYIGSKLGNDKVYEYVKKMGFGKPTNVDLQGEVGGSLKSRDNWYPIDYATVTFGQGIGVTPLQMVRAFSAVVNGGKLMQPYVVKKVIDSRDEKERNGKIEARIFSERTSAILRKMLVDTVNNGEVKWAKPDGYKIGGKTGTAQIAIQGHYDPTKTIASFIGFAPADKPRFVALVVLKEPRASIWGAETAAPIFFDIAKDLLVYYNIPPDGGN